MEKSWIPLVVGLVALLVGWVIGFFDSNLRTAKKIREAEAKAKFEVEQAKMQVEEAAKLAGQVSGNDKDQSNLLRLWKDPAQKLNLELDGQPVSPKNLTSDQSHRLVNLLSQVRPWLESSASKTPQPTPQPAKLEPERPIMNPVVTAVVAGGKVSPEPTAPDHPASMIDQINAVLQKNLAGTPLAKKAIRLQESLSGSLWIYVGLKRYDGIDAVPEEEIRAAIRQSVVDWERMNT